MIAIEVRICIVRVLSEKKGEKDVNVGSGMIFQTGGTPLDTEALQS